MIGQLLDRRYQIIREINSGNFSRTFLATDTHRPGAPQCVVREYTVTAKSAKARQVIEALFHKKATIIEKLGKHDRIPELLAVFQENNNLYLVEDFIAGQPLSEEMAMTQGLSETEVINLLSQILETLAFIHQHRVIHQSLIPSHILRRESDSEIILINFGLQQEINSQLTFAQVSKGNSNFTQNRVAVLNEPAIYTAIEQRQGNTKFNSDIYSLGVIAIQALTGYTESQLANLDELQKPETEKTWQQIANCSPTLAAIIDKMTEYYFDRRYQTVDEVILDLKPLVAQLTSEKPMNTPKVKSRKTREQGKIPPSLNRWLLPILAMILLTPLAFFLWQKSTNYPNKNIANQSSTKATPGDRQSALFAINHYTKVLEANPSDAQAYYNRANAYYDTSAYQQALKDYTSAIQLEPNRSELYYNRSLTYLDLQDRRSAITDLNEVIKLEENNTDALYKRGTTYYELGEYRAAIEDFDRAIRLSPKQADIYIDRGLAKSALADRAGALADFTEALNLTPNDAIVYYNRGRVRFSMADYQGAVDDYNKAIEIDPKQADAYANRCSAKINLAQIPAAIEDCTAAIRIDPKHAAAYNNRCIANLRMGAYQKASEDCSLTIGLNVNDPKAYSNRGLARLASGNKQGAIEDFTEAIRLNPNDSVAYSNRGKTYGDLVDYNRAIEDYAQAIRLNPANSTAYYNRGLIRKELKDLAGAIEDFQKAGNLFLEQGRAEEYKKAQEQITQTK